MSAGAEPRNESDGNDTKPGRGWREPNVLFPAATLLMGIGTFLWVIWKLRQGIDRHGV
jgi:hypothetical protein